MSDLIDKVEMTQRAPYPTALESLVQRVTFKPRWRFWLGDTDRDDATCRGLTLVITVTGPNSYAPEELINVAHYFPVPSATYDERAWRRWLFDCCLGVETHEAGEFFKIDGSRPYAPNHGPGRNPYIVHERGTEEDARTSSSGGDIGNEP